MATDDTANRPDRAQVVCEWIKDEDGIYNTACGHAFVFNDDGPTENGFTFCAYCGGRLNAEPVRVARVVSRTRPVKSDKDWVQR